jgi:hypothetical protein
MSPVMAATGGRKDQACRPGKGSRRPRQREWSGRCWRTMTAFETEETIETPDTTRDDDHIPSRRAQDRVCGTPLHDS